MDAVTSGKVARQSPVSTRSPWISANSISKASSAIQADVKSGSDLWFSSFWGQPKRLAPFWAVPKNLAKSAKPGKAPANTVRRQCRDRWMEVCQFLRGLLWIRFRKPSFREQRLLSQHSQDLRHGDYCEKLREQLNRSFQS
jgi:hypothetical protein